MIPRFPASLRYTIGLLVLVIEGVVLLTLGTYYYREFSAEVDRRLDEAIAKPGALVMQGALSTDAFGQRETLENLVGPALEDALIVTTDGMTLVALDPARIGAGAPAWETQREGWQARAATGGFTERHADGTNSYLIRVAPVVIAAGQTPVLFSYLKLQTTENERELANLRLRLIGGSVTAIVVTTIALLLTVNWLVTRRLQRVADAVDQVTAGNYANRIAPGSLPDEIGHLSTGVNTMIHRLGEAFDGLQGAIRQLEAAEQKYRVLVDNAAEAIFVAQDGRVVFSNPKLCQLLDVRIDDVLTLPITKFIHPDDQSMVLERHQQRLRGEAPPDSYEFRMISATGRPLWVGLTAVRIEWKGTPAILSFMSDVTERKQAEESIRISQAQLLASLENPPNVAIQWYDDAGQVLYWNPASEVLYGFKSAEAVGKTLDQLIHTQEEAQEFMRVLEGIRDTGKPFGPYEASIRRRDGRTGWVLATTFALPLGNGRTGFACIDMDITDRKRAEAEKEQLTQQLIQAQKLESVGRLAGGVAHDFNNMLQSILGNVDLALLDVPKEHAAYESLVEIKASARRSAELTGQLLAFARKQTAAPKIINLNDTTTSALTLLRRLIGEQIELVFNQGTRLWPIEIDPGQVDQILTNLCVNARDAMTGAGRITIDTSNLTLDGTYLASHPGCHPGEYVLLAVSDNGQGIDRETLPHIFEPFFTTKGVGKGTGLGLATVFGIVKQNGSLINVYSEPGQGTTFKIYFPRSTAALTAGAAAPQAPTARGSETVLLVEDEEQVLKLARKILTQHGYTVLTAETPAIALELAKQNAGAISLLITDVMMPGMNGRELRELLRATNPTLKCLFMSGYTADIIAQQGILHDGIEFMQKPFTIQGITEKIRAVLES